MFEECTDELEITDHLSQKFSKKINIYTLYMYL